ncbi:quinone oxidoreductase family protein [Brevibacillus daliensis]|uniref:quinone oxidoreductase family protein n=1 Tax=Brevibacillus daliensis TaxID=2892995 RepID=UPI001E6367D4|nr:NADPH:quinone oxidoreductase family protein [Brevibacillus daliensis]
MMKAVHLYEFGSPEVLKVVEVQKPIVGANEVLIQVQAIGLNYAEVQIRRGTYPYPQLLPAVLGQWGVVAGRVVEIGESVTDIKIGTNVISQVPSGSYAEYVVVPSFLLLPSPERITPTQSTALLTQGQTAYHTLKSAGRMQAGDTVLIHAAAGGVGSLAILAKAFKAGKVIATASTPAKLELAQSLGADVVINYRDPNWTQKVLEHTEGKGVDIILEMVGGDILKGSLYVLRPFGRLIYFGSASASNEKWDQVNLVKLLKNKSIVGFNIEHFLTSFPDIAKSGLEHLYQLISTGQLNPVVQHIFPLDHVVEAHRLLESRQTVGTVVLLP